MKKDKYNGKERDRGKGNDEEGKEKRQGIGERKGKIRRYGDKGRKGNEDIERGQEEAAKLTRRDIDDIRSIINMKYIRNKNISISIIMYCCTMRSLVSTFNYNCVDYTIWKERQLFPVFPSL